MSPVRIARVYHPDPGGEGSRIRLSKEESHHLTRVLRVGNGAAVRVFDGRGSEWSGEIVAASGSVVEVRVDEPLGGRADPSFRVVVYQALCRPERMEWMIQKGTEIGLFAIRPIRAGRVDAGKRAEARSDRWARIALEACKQCGRRTLPEIAPPANLPVEVPEGTEGWMLHAGEGSDPVSDALRRPPPAALWIAVGPEGGFLPEEVERCRTGGWRRVGLGPRTLRAETAGIVAASLALHAWGDLGV